jgi:hypothetical protein
VIDDHVHEARDLARCVLADALLAEGGGSAALALLARPCAAPALRARALAVRVRAGDSGAADEALRLLSSVELAPLAEIRLLGALADCPMDAGLRAGARRTELLARLRADPANAGLLAHWTDPATPTAAQPPCDGGPHT